MTGMKLVATHESEDTEKSAKEADMAESLVTASIGLSEPMVGKPGES